MSSSPIASRTIWFLVSNIANAGISFATMILLARVLKPVEYGVLAIFFTYTAVLTSFAGLSLEGSVSITFFRRTADELRLHVSSCIVLISAIVSGISIVVGLLSSELSGWLNLTNKWLFLGLVCVTAQAIVNIKLSLLMAKGAATQYATIQIGQCVVFASLTFVLIYGTQLGWEARAWALVITNILFSSGAVFSMFKDGECTNKISLKEMRLALNFGAPLIPHVLGAIMFSSVDRFLVNGLLGAASTGLYQFAAQIGSIVMIVTDAINKAFSPWLYRHLNQSSHAERKKIVKLTYAYFAIALMVSALFFIAPVNLASLFGGSDYSSAGDLIPFFILGNCIGGMYFMVVNYIFYTSKTGYLSAATLFSGLIGVGACYFLTGELGIIGAGISFVIGKFIHFAATWAISSRIFPMPWMLQSTVFQKDAF